MTKPIDFTLIDRYLAGEATPEERRQLEQDAEAMAVVRGLHTTPPSWDTDAAWQRLARNRPRRIAPWLRIAALLVIALGVSVVLMSRRNAPAVSIAAAEHTTAVGERRTVTLADGSTVVLAPATSLRVPVTFGDSTRDVYLTGEAFFEVAHDAAKPFIVHTRLAQTEVLGTAFNVRAYQNDTMTEVALQRGKVGVRPVDSDIVLLMNPGQIVRATAIAAAYDTTHTDVSAFTSWATGQLSFNNWTLSAIVERLEAWYGVDIAIADAQLARTRVTAYLPAGTLEEVLTAISETAGASFERVGSTITLQRRR
jgi:transmembrane sensor